MIEKSLDRKMYHRYLGPMIVIRRTKGGSYVVAQMDGMVLREKVAAFRVLPHVARYKPIKLPENITELIDISKERLDELVNDIDEKDLEENLNEDFAFRGMPSFNPSYGNFVELADNDVPTWDASDSESEEDDDNSEDSVRRSKQAQKVASTGKE